jgi:regulatory protein
MMRQRRKARGDAVTDSAGAAAKPPPSAKVMAVRMLARREYSRAELAQRLAHKGIARDAVERALDELKAAGYLSDARYANAMVAQRSGRYGKRAIAHALREKGIEAADAQAAMAPLTGVDEVADATALWQQRFGTAPANQREKARQVRFLLSRGYGLSVALRVLRAAGSPSDDDA